MSNFFMPQSRAIDTSGNPISGAKLNFYEAGTSTPLDSYSDAALSSANANPVVADANGYFGRIFLKVQSYKVVFTDADDVTIWTEDNYDATLLNDDSLSTRQSQIASNPLDEGAVGDGVADESTQVQAAIDGATGVVDLLGKTFRCDTMLTIPSNIRLQNGTLNFTNSTENTFVRIRGTRGTDDALSSNVSIGDITATVTSGAGFAADDTAYIRSTGNWNTSHNKGSIFKLKTASGTSVLNTAPFLSNFTTANSAAIEELTTKKNIEIRDVKFVCSSTQSGSGHALELDIAEDVIVDRCVFENFKSTGILMTSCIGVQVTNSRFVGNVLGIGVDCGEASRDVWIQNCTARNVATGFWFGKPQTHDGVTRYCKVESCLVDGATANSVYIDVGGQYIDVLNCEFHHLTQGYGYRCVGVDSTIKGCKIRGATSAAISIEHADVSGSDNSPYYWTIEDNEVGFNGLKVTLGANSLISTLKIKGNILDGQAAASQGIIIDISSGSTSAHGNIEITDNSLQDGKISFTSAAIPVRYLSISRNNILANGIIVSSTGGNVQFCDISSNVITGTTPTGIEGVKVGGVEHCKIHDNHIDMVPGSGSSAAVEVTATGPVIATGNQITTTVGNALNILGTPTATIVSGNYTKAPDTSVNINISAATDSISVTSNLIVDGTYGILVTGSPTESLNDSNVFVSQATGTVSGIFATTGSSA